jgi:DNA-3-methyladenine glycosylase II
LARRDPVIGALMRAHGPCGLAAAQHDDPFRALTRAIVGQQLSTKAAATIYARFASLCSGNGRGARPTPQAVARVSDAELRAVGLSGQKLAYIRDLSVRVLDGSLNLKRLDALGDEDVIAALTAVKGVGRWTAEMFLIFRLQRPDVLPVGDLGILKAVQRAYGLRGMPSPQRLTRIGESWRPYRSIACWYLWRSLDNAPT